MAIHEIPTEVDFSEELRKLETSDPGHADTFNPLFERLIKNDAFMQRLTATHLAGKLAHLVVVTRDISIAGIQIVSIPFKAKNLICFATIEATKASSNGLWAENNLQRSIAIDQDTQNSRLDASLTQIVISPETYAVGIVQNVTSTGFEINWTKFGSPTGTATMFIVASSHGGE